MLGVVPPRACAGDLSQLLNRRNDRSKRYRSRKSWYVIWRKKDHLSFVKVYEFRSPREGRPPLTTRELEMAYIDPFNIQTTGCPRLTSDKYGNCKKPLRSNTDCTGEMIFFLASTSTQSKPVIYITHNILEALLYSSKTTLFSAWPKKLKKAN